MMYLRYDLSLNNGFSIGNNHDVRENNLSGIVRPFQGKDRLITMIFDYKYLDKFLLNSAVESTAQ